MKKRFLSILGASLLISISALAAEYHYGFILSCGYTHYVTLGRELSDSELASLAELYESMYCRESMPIE